MRDLLLCTAAILALAVPAFAAGEHDDFGEPGDPARADRTVQVVASDDGEMAYAMDLDLIRQGETIRFVVTNRGEGEHEFSINDADGQRAHAAMMAAMPDMHHGDEPATIVLEPGQTKEIVWTFSQPIQGDVVFACNIPGHAEAGMIRKVAFERG